MNKHRIHLFVLFSIIAYCNNVNAHIIDTLSYSVNELKIKANGNYTVFSMPFFQTTQEIGNPELPSATLYYIIPCDKRVVSITVLDSTMATIPGTYLVFPKQPETPIGNYRTYDFVNPNTSVYGSNNPYPEQPLSILDHCAIDGYQLVGISVCPLRYLPLTGKIEMITSIRFQLTFENSSETIMRPLTQPRNMFETTKNLILSQIRNKNDFNQINDGPLCITEPNSKATHGVNYWGLSLDVDPEFIIITNNNDVSGNSLFDPISGKNMTDVFQEFADWKTQKGMPTTVITVDDICSNYSGNDTQAKIHNFLTDVYHHYGMLYLILGGDVNVVPARILDTIHDGFHYSNPFLSDLYYTGVQTTWDSNRNGIYGEKRSGSHNNDQLDHTPEFYYGRVPAKNVSDAMAFVDKNMVYGNFVSVEDSDYVNNIGAMVGYGTETDLNSGTLTTPMEWIEDVFGNTLPVTNFGICQTKIQKWRSYDSDNVDISVMDYWLEFNRNNAMACFSSLLPLSIMEDQHSHLTIHIDHSSYQTMGTSSIKNNQHINRNDVDLFGNAPYYQIVYSMGCFVGDFGKDCIAEHFINNPQGGAVAMVASTTFYYPLETSNIQYFLANLYENLKNGSLKPPRTYQIGTTLYSILKDYNVISKTHLFGDPELPIWTRESVNLTVSTTPSVITNIDNELTVSVRGMAYSEYATNDVMVCVMKDDEVYLREHYDGTAHNHDFVFEIDPETAGMLKVTVTGHNYIPYETTVPVTITGKHFYISDKSVVDDSGNNNGKLDAGETDHLRIALTNNGTVSLTDVTATLNCEFSDESLNQNINDYLTLVTPTANYGTIAPNNTITRSNFQIVLSKTVPDRTTLHCTITLSNNTGVIGTRSFSLPVGAPEIEYVSAELETKPNGRIGVDVALTNTGFGTAKGVAAILTSPYDVQITQGTAAYGAMAHLEAKTQSFEFVSPGNFVELPFILNVVDAYNKSWSFGFTLRNVLDTVENLKFESTEHSIRLKWDPVVDSRGYYVYRSLTASGSYERLNSYPIPSSAYPDLGLDAKQVYYYAVSYLDEDGNESGKARITAWTTLPVAEGWPVNISDNLGRAWGTALNVADIDSDGKLEIFLTTGNSDNPGDEGAILGFNYLGEELYDIDHNPTTISGFANIGISMTCTPAIGDIDNDGVMEIAVATRDNPDSGNHYLYVYKNEDANKDGVPDLAWRDSLDFQNFNGVVLADLDDDGTLEIIAPNQGKRNVRTVVEVFDCFGDTIRTIKVPFSYNVDEKAVTMPVVTDLDSDGHKEIVFGLEGGVYSWSYPTGPLHTLVSFNPSNAERTDCPVIAAEIDEKENLEILYMAVRNGMGYVRAINSDGTSVNGWDGDAHFVSLSNTNMDWAWPPYFSVADIDNDGSIEIFVADKDTLKMWSSDGTAFGIGEIHIPNLDCRYLQPVIADVDGLGDCEIIIPSQDGHIHAYKPNGDPVPGWPLAVADLATIPVVADIDGNGYNEVVAASQTELFVWHTEGRSRYNHCDRFRYNKYNNAVYDMPCSYAEVPLEISGSQVWSDDRHVIRDVVINNGACLTIKSEIRFSEDSRIVVKPGGRLVLDGGKLTNACPDVMWPGIEVWGNSSANQYPVNGTYAQGYLELKNGAVIENAVCAVELWRPNHWSSMGGIVIANDAVFRNNAKSVHAINYTNHHPLSGAEAPNATYFQNCSFVIDDEYFGTEIFHKHVDLDRVNGITFSGCSFSVDPDAPNVSSTNHGIAAYDAGFTVLAWCSYNNGNMQYKVCPDEYLVRSVFTGFHDAVHAVSYNGAARSFSVRNSLFYDNDRGVFAQNTGYATILDNEFRVGSDEGCSYGVYVKDVTGFCIEENDFTALETRSVNFGIGVFDCSADNDVYLNTFDGFDCGNVAVGVNAAVVPEPPVDLPMSGLTYSCNQNTGNVLDFCVLKDGNIGGIDPSQGSTASPAGNTFSGSEYHFYNDGDQYVSYYCNSGGTGQTPDLSKLYRVSRVSVANSNSCLSHYGQVSKSPQEMSELENSFLSAQEAFSGLMRIYASRLDGGNTPAEVAELNSANPSDAQRLRARLLGLSPYLSRQVLAAAADRHDVFSDPVLFEILAANPDELKKDTLINYLEQRNPPLPAYMIDVLQQIAAGATPRTVLTAQMAQYRHEASLAAGDIVRSILNDSVADPQRLRSWLGNIGEITSDRLAVASYMQEGDFESALGLAALLPELYGLDGDGLRDHSDYMRLLELFRTLHVSGRNVSQMTESELGTVDSIADGGTGFSKSMAEALRESVTGEPRTEEFACPDLPVTRGTRGNTGVDESGNESFYVSLTPNPAKSLVYVNYILPEGMPEAVLEITSVLGVKVIAVTLEGQCGSKEIDLGRLSPGVYNYTAYCGNNVFSGKLMITH